MRQNFFELCFQPQKQAHNWFDDGYNGVLIRDLLSQAEPVGQVMLTQEEMAEYKTIQWYFAQLPEEEKDFLNRDLKYLQSQGKKIGLTNILPQHYHNNYRIAFWILQYGWLPAMALLAGIAGMCGLLFLSVSRSETA